jgi:imidazolonepropionase-like amidohydrolase
MKQHPLELFIAVALVLAMGAANAQSTAATAFIDVHVLPMDTNRVLDHQTVLVTDGKIAAMGPVQTVKLPAAVRRINAAGQWLLPGLADMHVHVNEDDDLALYVAQGVTTVLHMGSAPSAMVDLDRKKIASGTLVGPQMFFGFLLDGNTDLGLPYVTTPKQARAAVQFAKADHYDYIKVYNSLSPPAFHAIVDEAHRQGMSVIGHGVRAVGLPAALTQGQVMVAHAEEFFYTAFANKIDDAAIPGVVAATRASGAWVTPNLSGYEAIADQWGHPNILDSYLHTPQAAALSPRKRMEWSRSGYQNNSGDLHATYAFLQRFTKALSDADVPLLTGTDSPFIPGMMPGISEHDDLRDLVAAGLTPYQALSAATRVPGEFVKKTLPGSEPFGTVQPGMRADLLLARDNPLVKLNTLRAPLGVMVEGRWYDAAALAKMLDDRKRRYERVLSSP